MKLSFRLQRHLEGQNSVRIVTDRCFHLSQHRLGTPEGSLAIILRAFIVSLAVALIAPLARGDILVNGDFEAGNTGFTASSAYTYSASTDVGPGDYGLLSNPNDAGGFFSIGDHTTGTGRMLFVDASPIPLTAFWSETVSVAPNTNYLFSGYAREVDPYPDEGILRLLVNNAAVGSDAALAEGSPSGSWQSFTDAFNSGANTSLTLSLVDANPSSSAGNDFVVDDLSLSPVQVPEPHSGVMVAAAMVAFIGCKMRRRLDSKRSPAELLPRRL